MNIDRFFRCGNCQRFYECKRGQTTATADTVCDSFDPLNARKYKIKVNDEDEGGQNLFVKPEGGNRWIWFLELGGKPEGPITEEKGKFWRKDKIRRKIAKSIVQHCGVKDANLKFILLQIEEISRMLDADEITQRTTHAKIQAGSILLQIEEISRMLDADEITQRTTHAKIQAGSSISEDEAMEILRNKKLLNIYVAEISKKVVGEKETIKTILLYTAGRLVKNAELSSYNLHINDYAGVGKDYIVKAVMEAIPDECSIHRTKITPELFTYWHNPKFEPEWTWDGKVFYLEDVPDKILQSEPFKVMASGGSKATVLINQTPIDIEIKGKPVMIITSYKTHPSDEILRRFPIINLDESENQTLKIMQKQSENAETGNIIKLSAELKQAQKHLKRVHVKVPFASKLPQLFPKNIFMRTNFQRFLDLIKASAALHQYSRRKDEDGYILAGGNDYNNARVALLKSASNPNLIPLTKQQEGIMEFFEKHRGWHSVSDIEDKFPFSTRWLRKQLDDLYFYGLLKKDKEVREGVKKPVMIYSFDEQGILTIPTFEEISSLNSLNSFNSHNTKSTDKPHINEEQEQVNYLNYLNKISTTQKKKFNVDTVAHKKNFVSLIEQVMAEKPAYKWHYTEIAEALDNYNPEYLRERLEEITSSPSSNTRIRNASGGYYVLIEEVK